MKERRDISGRVTPARTFLEAVSGLRANPAMAAVRASVKEQGRDAWLVGGALRDLASGKAPVNDLDFVVTGDPGPVALSVAETLDAAAFVIDRDAPAWRVVTGGEDPSVVVDFSPPKGDVIAADLRARDFTINALGVSIESIFSDALPELIDPTGGYADVRGRTIRATSEVVFDEDPLRVMRAVRLSVELGFDIAPETRALAGISARLLGRTSRERVRDEFLLMFDSPDTVRAIEDLYELGITAVVAPDFCGWEDVDGYPLLEHTLAVVRDVDALIKEIELGEGALIDAVADGEGYAPEQGRYAVSMLARFATERYAGIRRTTALKLAAFMHDAGKALTISREDGRLRFIGHDREGARLAGGVLRSLRFSNRAASMLSGLARDHHRVFNLRRLIRPSARARANLFRRSDENAGGDEGAGLMLLLLAIADARATIGGEDPALVHFVASLIIYYFCEYIVEHPEPVFTGAEIIELFGVAEGPIVGEIMRLVSDAVDSGEVTGREDAVEFVRRWLGARDEG